MKKKVIYTLSLTISIFLLVVSFLFRIQHYPGQRLLFILTTLFSIVYVFIALFDIYIDENKTTFEKGGWLIGFLLLTPIFGIVYYFTHIIKNKSASA